MQRINKSFRKTKPSQTIILMCRAIDIYRFFLGPFTRSFFGISNECRYSLSCSKYTKQSILYYGVKIGTLKAVKRIISCR